jgi:hypothetical protein
MKHSTLPIITVATLAAASTAAAAQDITVHMSSDAGDRSIYYISQNAVRYINTVTNSDVIYRLHQNTVIVLDPKSKTYRKASPSAMLASEDASLRKELLHQFGFDAPPTITRLGPGDAIAGHNTEKYLLTTPSVRVEFLVAPSVEMPTSYYEANSVLRMSFFDMTKFDQEMKKIKGAVMKRSLTMTMPGMVQRYTETATSVDRNPIPPSTFDIPASYRAAN